MIFIGYIFSLSRYFIWFGYAYHCQIVCFRLFEMHSNNWQILKADHRIIRILFGGLTCELVDTDLITNCLSS